MKQKNIETILYSTAGVAVMFVCLLAFYVVTSAFKTRIDLTADKAFTLSPGTKRILGQLDSPVTIRFYCTQSGTAMPPALRTYAQQIEDLLGEYQQAAKGKIIVQKFDPQPDSDAEDSARLDGMAGQPTSRFGGDKIYLGLRVSMLDQKSDPALAAARPRAPAGIRHLARHRPRHQSHPRHHRLDERAAGLRLRVQPDDAAHGPSPLRSVDFRQRIEKGFHRPRNSHDRHQN